MQSTSALRKIFTMILVVYGFNIVGRLIAMDQQFLDGTLDTSATSEATIRFMIYSALSGVIALLTLVVGWPYKWLRYGLILFLMIAIAAFFIPHEWLNGLPIQLPKWINLQHSFTKIAQELSAF
jgi:hypothetical protein